MVFVCLVTVLVIACICYREQSKQNYMNWSHVANKYDERNGDFRQCEWKLRQARLFILNEMDRLSEEQVVFVKEKNRIFSEGKSNTSREDRGISSIEKRIAEFRKILRETDFQCW